MLFRTLQIIVFSLPFAFPATGEPAAGASPEAAAIPVEGEPRISPALRAAIEKLSLPGVKINLEAWSVDVESEVCLREGLLELVACTKDSKEHESIIVVAAKPSHIHTALLLLGAKPGSPAQRKLLEGEQARFIDLPARGEGVDVFLVIKGPDGKETQYPISDFIVRADRDSDFGGRGGDPQENEEKSFPAQPFVFAGSFLVGEGDGPRKYVCDQSGNVISITTFGDELLSLSGFHDTSNDALAWQVGGDKLPPIGGKVTLRIVPKVQTQKSPAAGDSPSKQGREEKLKKATGN